MVVARVSGISLVTSVQSLQALGVVPKDARGTDALWVGWSELATVLNGAAPALGGERMRAFAQQWLRRHPLFRATSPFAASTPAWLELFWAVVSTSHPAIELQWRATTRGSVLEARLGRGLEPSTVWFELMAELGALAPTLIGAPSLRMTSKQLSSTTVLARYESPAPTSPGERRARTSDIPLTTIFSSLKLLNRSHVLASFRDGAVTDAATEDGAPAVASRYGLTPTETKVLAALSEGLTAAELARELEMAVATARVHLKRIYAKTGTSGQRELLQLVSSWTIK